MRASLARREAHAQPIRLLRLRCPTHVTQQGAQVVVHKSGCRVYGNRPPDVIKSLGPSRKQGQPHSQVAVRVGQMRARDTTITERRPQLLHTLLSGTSLEQSHRFAVAGVSRPLHHLQPSQRRRRLPGKSPFLDFRTSRVVNSTETDETTAACTYTAVLLGGTAVRP